jgi:hypothetical protein
VSCKYYYYGWCYHPSDSTGDLQSGCIGHLRCWWYRQYGQYEKEQKGEPKMGLQTDIDSIEASLRKFETNTFDRLSALCNARPLLRESLHGIIYDCESSANEVGNLFITYALEQLSEDILKVAKAEITKRINEAIDAQEEKLKEFRESGNEESTEEAIADGEDYEK